MAEDMSRPLLAGLLGVLAGEPDMVILRPPLPKFNPRHDLYGWHPAPASDLRELLGEENFAQPEKEKPAAPSQQTYTIGQLGNVINRTGATVRKWIREGFLPEADHWTQGQTGIEKLMPDGRVVQKGARKRLFTHSQVMGLLAIATEEGLVQNRTKGIGGTNFAERAQQLWEECADDERALS